MMAKHIDLFAIGAVLLGIFIYTQVKEAVLVRVFNQRGLLRIERIVIRAPEPPVFPIAFMK